MTSPNLQPTASTAATSTFGRYRILKKLSSGGMGEIFLASLDREEGFSKQLVIKKLLPSLSQNPAFVNMFNNEARLAAQLSHTNIVQIFDFGRTEETQFIAMEWVHGENLSDVLTHAKEKAGHVPVRVACQIALAVLRGLDYAHRKRGPKGEDLGLIHRDVAPKNVLVSYEGEVKLIDFGLAKAAAAGDATEGGALKGSYCYMSPEQVSGGAMDARSDLFSAALVLYEMLAGEKLFPPEMGLRPLLEAIHHMDLAHWSQRGKDPWQALPDPLARILQKSLSRSPSDRYQSAREFVEAIEGFLREGNGAYPEISIHDYMQDLFAEKIAASQPATSASAGGLDRTQVSAGAQKALLEAAQAAQAEEGPVVVTPGRLSHFIFNSLAVIVILAIVGGGGFLGYHFLIKPRLIASKYGVVRVVTDPPGADLSFDGVPLNLASPYALEPWPIGGEHVLRVSKPGFVAQERRIQLKKGGEREILEQFTLAKAHGQVFVVSDPPGAKVTLDGKQIAGKTPVLLEQVEMGTEHELLLKLASYRDEPIHFELTSSERPERFTVEMMPLVAKVRITSKPAGARIFIGGKRTPHYTPYETSSFEIGSKVDVRVKKPGYKGASKSAGVKMGRNDFAFTLEPLIIEARLKSKGKVNVLLDEKPVPANPLRLDVGDHLIRVQVAEPREEFRLRLQVREHSKRNNGLLIEANVDARPWAKVKAVRGSKEDAELTTPVSGVVFSRGANRLLVALPGGSRLELSFDVP